MNFHNSFLNNILAPRGDMGTLMLLAALQMITVGLVSGDLPLICAVIVSRARVNTDDRVSRGATDRSRADQTDLRSVSSVG